MAEKVVSLIVGIKECLQAYQREGADFFTLVQGFKTTRFNGKDWPDAVPYGGISMSRDQFVYDENSIHHDYYLEIWIVDRYPNVDDITESDAAIYMDNNANGVASWLKDELQDYIAFAGNPIVEVGNVIYEGEGRIGAQPSLAVDYSFAVIELNIRLANYE